jgi:RNA polymerase sigma-54 factor
VAARDLRESMLLQLQRLDAGEPWRNAALNIVHQHFELLASRDYASLLRRSKLNEADLQKTLQLIQSLNPRPGNQVSSSQTEYIVPDVVVRKYKGRWRAELNHDATPRLGINRLYADLAQRHNGADVTYLRNQLQEARWFIKSLKSRNETLLKVTQCIVDQQYDFFDQGEEAMQPLVMANIAQTVGMHESTISRVTTKKYMHSPRGIFELKYFFSSHVSTSGGGEASATAIRAIIKKLIAAEKPSKPLSDSKLASLLEEQGIQVARRTVAKYRESMSIAPSNERKRFI